MRKLLAILVVTTLLMLMAVPAAAQRCGRLRHRHSNVTHTHYACIGDSHKHGRSFWQKHRDKLTTAGGVGAGALIGGIAGSIPTAFANDAVQPDIKVQAEPGNLRETAFPDPSGGAFLRLILGFLH